MKYLALVFAALGLAASVAAQGRLIAIDSSGALVELNMTTGARTSISTLSSGGTNVSALAYDRQSGTLWATTQSNDSLYTLNIDTGVATLVGAFGFNSVMHGLEYNNSTGILYGMDALAGTLYTINKTTGLATSVGTHGITSNTNLGYNLNNGVMYATNSSTDSLYSVNMATGSMTLIGGLGGPTLPNALAFNHDNNTMYLTDTQLDTLLTINLTTGAATTVGSTGVGNLQGLAYVNPVPEPATIVGIGLGLVFLLRRRMR